MKYLKLKKRMGFYYSHGFCDCRERAKWLRKPF